MYTENVVAADIAFDISKILYSGMESDQPQTAILAYLTEHNGKQLTKRDLPKLRNIDLSICYRDIANMTHIDWGDYGRSGGNKGGSLLVAYTGGAPIIDAAWVKERNISYFTTAERNEKRAKALKDDPTIMEAALAIQALVVAKAKLAHLMRWDDDGTKGPLEIEKYSIQQLYEQK
jgi:hypothetical protein